MSGSEREEARAAILAAARARLREHLDREAAALAGDDAEAVLAEVEHLTEQLREVGR